MLTHFELKTGLQLTLKFKLLKLLNFQGYESYLKINHLSGTWIS